MAGGKISEALIYGLTVRESATDGSDFTNPAADYRRLFLGEDGQLHVKDSAGAVTGIGGSIADILDIPTAETDDTLVLAPDGAGGVEFRAEAGGGGGLIGVSERTANGTNYTTTSSTQADVDASNAAVTFTAPASGNVLVRMTAPINVSSAQNGYFGIRESTTDVGAKRLMLQGSNVGTRSAAWLISGISAGSHTYKAAFSVNGSATLTIYQEGAGAGNGGIILEVWAAP